VWLVGEETRSEAVCRVAHQDLAGLRGLLEPRRHVDGVAEHAELALLVADGTRDRETSVDADAQREVAARALRDARVLAVQRAKDRERGALRARRMVGLVANRAEHRHDRVSDVLLDEPAGRADLHGDRVPRGAHVLVELFRIETLRERGESRDVREEDRDLPGLALDGRQREKPRAALSTEAERDRHLRRALWTSECRSPHQPTEVTAEKLSSGCRRGVLASHPIR